MEQLRQRRPDVPWLIPVRFDNCKGPDLDLGAGRTLDSIQRTDLFGDHYHEQMKRLVVSVQRLLRQRPPGQDARTEKTALASPQAAQVRPSIRTVRGRLGRRRDAGTAPHGRAAESLSPARQAPKTARAGTTHAQAYAELTRELLAVLHAVDTPESAHAFTSLATEQIKTAAVEVPQFYLGEFFNIFKDAVLAQVRTEVAASEQALRDAQAEANSATAELQARLARAKASGDRQAEHDVWREREVRQGACQAKIAQATERIDVVNLQVEAWKELASALGVSFS